MMLNYSETHNLTADIRNKLGSFWNIVAMLRSGDQSEALIALLKIEAETAHQNKDIILSNLDKILDIANELQTDINDILGIDSNPREYIRPVPKYADLMTLAEWDGCVSEGGIMADDGCGYWVKDGMVSKSEVFNSERLDATHVAWFNK